MSAMDLILSPIALLVFAIVGSALIWFVFANFFGKYDTAVVSELWIYPIKSCKGIRVKHAQIDTRGFRYDRLFMLVAGTKNRFISQRTHPKLALVSTDIDTERNELTLTAPNMPVLTVSLLEPEKKELLEVQVWDDACMAHDIGEEGSAWFSKFLELEQGCKLVRMTDEYIRETDKKYSLNNGQTGFADGFPFLLASVASLEAVNERLAKPILMNNFRPNIVVKGCSAFAEDSWKRVLFNNSLEIAAIKPCGRCKMPNNNPETGVMDTTFPVSTVLKEFRSGKDLKFGDKSWESEVFFGINLDNPSRINALTGSSISVGHSVKGFQ